LRACVRVYVGGKVGGGMTVEQVMEEYEAARHDVLAALCASVNRKQRADCA